MVAGFRAPAHLRAPALISGRGLVEWWAALALGQDAEAFLGTQGDPWDTQSDMFMALIGAVTALLTLARLEDRQIERRTAPEAAVAPPAGG